MCGQDSDYENAMVRIFLASQSSDNFKTFEERKRCQKSEGKEQGSEARRAPERKRDSKTTGLIQSTKEPGGNIVLYSTYDDSFNNN
jgi:hypothetical protein